MRQLELPSVHRPLKKTPPAASPSPLLPLGDEARRELLRLMALAIVAVLRSDVEAADER